jgi:uncharacterized protein YjbI with pentapeptide repeats
MTSTFRGKWTILSPSYKKYVGHVGSDDRLCVRDGPGKETFVVFILRSANELCFFLQNGKYVAPGHEIFNLIDHREHAGVFEFPGHDYHDLPNSFTSKIHNLVENLYMLDVSPFVMAENSPTYARVFTITQHTPTLEQIQTSKNGDGLDLAGVDLSGGALDQASLVGTDFSHSNLSDAKFTNCTLTKALLNNCTMVKTDLSGSNLSGAKLDEVNLTGVVIGTSLPKFCTNPDQAPSPTERRTTFFKATLNQSLLGLEFSKLDLSGATLKFEPQVYTDKHFITAKHSILTGLNENNLSKVKLQFAVFDYAVLNNVDFSSADLTNASFQFASMHHADLSGATLKGAKMKGAQLGSLSQLFTLPAGFETHLKTGTVDADLRNQFLHNGVTLSDAATVSTIAADRVWQLNDSGHSAYTIRLEGDPSVLTVYNPGVAATLADAYMPDADLSQANLYGVVATGVQFYGNAAKVEQAILEKVAFNNANLSTANFTQAQMRGANLSSSQLFNAKFNKAILSPSADGVAVNLTNSNLQGADFTDAQLFDAILTNAAVAINVKTTPNPQQGGVYLFTLPFKGDTATLDQYKAELNAAAKSVMLPYSADPLSLDGYKTALDAKDLKTLQPGFIKQKIVLTANAVITKVELSSVWRIVDGSKSYTVWVDIDPEVDPDQDPFKGDRLFVAPSLTKTQAGFTNSTVTLRNQAMVTPDTANLQWLVDNDSENPKNFSTGYVRFIVKLNGSVLDVYGSALRIVRLGDHEQQEFDTETCQVTKISQINMSADTVCPNGARLKTNQGGSGKTWDDVWMRATTPPKPPPCVPTAYRFCDDTQKKKKK